MISQRARDRAVTPLTADERDEIAAVAGATERSNRPTALVFLAGLVFIIACAVLLVSVTRQASAMSEVERRSEEIQQLRELVVDYGAIQLGQVDRGLPAPIQILSRIEEFAREAGIDTDLGLSGAGKDTVSDGVVRSRAAYSFRHPRLGDIMDWVRRVKEIDGVEVTRVAITPRNNRDWNFEIRFQRYERAN